jgi:hypothetical protein
LYSNVFYRLLEKHLTISGAAVVQTTSPLYARQSFWCIVRTLESAGLQVVPYHAYVPAFGEWGFALATRQPWRPPDRYPPGLRFLTPETTTALFQFPPDMASVETEINRLNNQILVRYYESEWRQVSTVNFNSRRIRSVAPKQVLNPQPKSCSKTRRAGPERGLARKRPNCNRRALSATLSLRTPQGANRSKVDSRRMGTGFFDIRKRMTKKIIFTLIGLLALVGLLVGTKVLQFKTMFAQGASFTPPPETVTTAEVKPDRWQPTLTAIGSITAVQGVMVSAEISGIVKDIAFESGATVKAGELLVELDAAIEQAQLRSAAASADLARANLERARTMRGKNMVSAADFDAA